MRARHIRQINSFGKTSYPAFKQALTQMVSKYGLDWFTDEQIADLREILIEGAWLSHKNARDNRAEAAYLDHQQSLMESGGADTSAYRRDMSAAGRSHLLLGGE